MKILDEKTIDKIRQYDPQIVKFTTRALENANKWFKDNNWDEEFYIRYVDNEDEFCLFNNRGETLVKQMNVNELLYEVCAQFEFTLIG